MAQSSADTPQAPEQDADLTRTYILVIVVEIVVVAGLYLLGVYFS